MRTEIIQPGGPRQTRRRAAVKSGAAMSAIVAGFALSACASSDSSDSVGGLQDNILSDYGLEGMNSREIIDHLDQQSLAERPADLMASVKTEELLLSNQDGEISLDLPADLSYVSVAPFVSQTHDCFYHSLTTCTGELGNEPIDVSVIDEESGEALYEGSVRTFDNGFAGFWLPRGSAGTITVDYQGLEGSTQFSTEVEDPTCLTDLRLI